MESTPTATPTDRLVQDWQNLEASLRDARKRVSTLECQTRNAENALGKRMDPGDMQVGEEISVWVRIDRKTERLLVVRKIEHMTYECSFRGKERPG